MNPKTTCPASWKGGLRNPLLWLLLAALALRLVCFLNSQNYSYDAVTRTLLAERWVQEPRLLPQPGLPSQYGPLPVWMMGLALKVWPNLDLAPRVVSLVLGTLAIIPFYYLAELLLGPSAAFIAGLLFACYSLHIRASVIASSEAVFSFFLLWSVYLLFYFRTNRRPLRLAGAALCLSLGALCRYTALIYLPIFLLLLWERDHPGRSLKVAAGFLTLALILPLVWLGLNYMAFGQALRPISTILGEHVRLAGSLQGWGSRIYAVLFWPAVAVLSLSPQVVGLAVIGAGRTFRRRCRWELLALALWPYLCLTVWAVSGRMFLLARFVTDSGLFILLLAAWGVETETLQSFREKYPNFRYWLTGSVFLWTLIILPAGASLQPHWVGEKLAAVSPISRLEPGQEEALERLSDLPPFSKVLVDHDAQWHELEIAFYAPSDIILDKRRYSQKDLLLKLSRQHFDYLLFFPAGYLRRIIDTPGLQNFKLQWDYSGYRLYQVAK